MESRFARRDFLKASGLSLAGAGLTMVLRPAGAWAIQGSQGVSSFLDQTGTNATYYNDASFNAADPYVLHDEGSGYYYAYSTDGGGQEATRLTLTYQRRKASGAYEDVYNVVRTPSGAQRRVLVSEIMSLTRDGQSKTSAQTS